MVKQERPHVAAAMELESQPGIDSSLKQGEVNPGVATTRAEC